jgi:hypothetical protein
MALPKASDTSSVDGVTGRAAMPAAVAAAPAAAAVGGGPWGATARSFAGPLGTDLLGPPTGGQTTGVGLTACITGPEAKIGSHTAGGE